MKYTYTTTKEMDEALAYNAEKNGQTAAELFASIIAADMETLVRNSEAALKDKVFAAYKTDPTLAATVDAAIEAAKPL